SELQDRWFLVLLRMVAAHVREPGAWSTRDELGIAKARDATTHVRAAFKGHVPEGFDVLQGDHSQRFRLNPEIAVEHVDGMALTKHADPQVVKLARQMA